MRARHNKNDEERKRPDLLTDDDLMFSQRAVIAAGESTKFETDLLISAVQHWQDKGRRMEHTIKSLRAQVLHLQSSRYTGSALRFTPYKAKVEQAITGMKEVWRLAKFDQQIRLIADTFLKSMGEELEPEPVPAPKPVFTPHMPPKPAAYSPVSTRTYVIVYEENKEFLVHAQTVLFSPTLARAQRFTWEEGTGAIAGIVNSRPGLDRKLRVTPYTTAEYLEKSWKPSEAPAQRELGYDY